MKLTEIVLLRVEGGEMEDLTLVAFSWLNLINREYRSTTTIHIVKLKQFIGKLNQ